MDVDWYMFEIEPKVVYLKWFIICDDESEHNWILENSELLKQEISLDISEQFGGHKVY